MSDKETRQIVLILEGTLIEFLKKELFQFMEVIDDKEYNDYLTPEIKVIKDAVDLATRMNLERKLQYKGEIL